MVRTHCVGCRPLQQIMVVVEALMVSVVQMQGRVKNLVLKFLPTKHKYGQGYRYNDITIFEKLGHGGIRILINY